MNTKTHKIPVDQIQNLEIDRNGRVIPRLNDLDPLENTLLSVLYPGVKVASVNVPVEPLDEYEESKVENAMANLVWRGIHYKLVGASGSAKKGKFYFVDHEHSRAIAERFQHWPQAAIVYFGILVSSCKVMMEESGARVLVVPDHSLGTNDCRGWIRRSVFGKLQRKHDAEALDRQVRKLLQQQSSNVQDKGLPLDAQERSALEEEAKKEIAGKILRAQRFYQFRLAFHNTQAKGSFKIMEDDVADALETDFILPESAVKPGQKMPVATYSIFGPGRRFCGPIAVGIREFSRQLEFESSYTLVEHAPQDSIQLEILPQAMEQVRKLSGAVGEGRYAELLEILGRPQDKSLADGPEQGNSDELNVIEGLLLADASGHIVRHPYVNNQLNKLLARWAFRVATGGGFRLPAFALMDDGYLFLKDGIVFHGSDWIPQHKAMVPLSSKRGLCVRYPIRMFEDLLPFENLSNKAPIEAFKGLVVGEEVSREMLEDCHFVNRAYAAIVSKIAERHEQLKQQLEKARADWDAARKSADRDLRKQKLFARTQAQGAYRFDEDRGKYEMKAILAYIRIWAQNKTEHRKAWLQALNRVVCGGKGSGSLLFLAFPQELVDKLAERTGGRFVQVHLPRLSEGLVHTDSKGRTFLVEPIGRGGEKQTFLWKYRDGKILLDDDNPAAPADNLALNDDPSGTAALPEADLDDVEFPPITSTEEDGNDMPWVM
jgi:hypothetical protein